MVNAPVHAARANFFSRSDSPQSREEHRGFLAVNLCVLPVSAVSLGASLGRGGASLGAAKPGLSAWLQNLAEIRRAWRTRQCTQPAPTFLAALIHRRVGKSTEDFWPSISASFPSLRCHWVLFWVAAEPRSVQQSPDHQRGLALIRGSTYRLVPKRNAGLRFDSVNRPFITGYCTRRFRLIRLIQSTAELNAPRHVRTFCPCAIKVTPSVS